MLGRKVQRATQSLVVSEPCRSGFTPGLQLGLLHQTSVDGLSQQIDMFSSLQLDALTLKVWLLQ